MDITELLDFSVKHNASIHIFLQVYHQWFVLMVM